MGSSRYDRQASASAVGTLRYPTYIHVSGSRPERFWTLHTLFYGQVVTSISSEKKANSGRLDK